MVIRVTAGLADLVSRRSRLCHRSGRRRPRSEARLCQHGVAGGGGPDQKPFGGRLASRPALEERRYALRCSQGCATAAPLREDPPGSGQGIDRFLRVWFRFCEFLIEGFRLICLCVHLALASSSISVAVCDGKPFLAQQHHGTTWWKTVASV